MAKNKNQNKKVQEVNRLINLNKDSRKYFYEKVDETWLNWLWENDFFDVLKEKADDPSRFSYKTPELRYLRRMVEINPELVTEIMLDIPISGETFNPEVIDQFINICSCLSGELLAKLVLKIKSENWPVLMQPFNQWGMDYGKMFSNLETSGHYEEIVILASAILDFRNGWEFKAKERYLDDPPFCFVDLSYSKVFQYLVNINKKNITKTIDLLLSVLTKLTAQPEEDQKDFSVFTRIDKYPLYDADIFSLSLRDGYHGSGQEDIREIVAAVKALSERMLLQQCGENAKLIFGQYFEPLPDSWLMWRIRLFILSLCPIEFMSQIKVLLFRIFSENKYSELIRGTEYKKALKTVFPLMNNADQTRFINLLKRLFSLPSEENKGSSKNIDGSQIFSVIKEYLSKEQISDLIAVGFEDKPGYVPTPLFTIGEVGFIKDKGPVNQEAFEKIPVSQIVDNLKTIWSPAQLEELDNQKELFNLLNAKGMGELIKNDVKTRVQEYLKHIDEFLDLERLDLHYLFSLLAGLSNTLEDDLNIEVNWGYLIDFCLHIINLGKENPSWRSDYEINKHNSWLAEWNAIYSEIVNLLKKILKINVKNLRFEWEFQRQKILSIIKFFFEYPDPTPKDELIDSAKITESIGTQNPLVCDPFTLAVNSIRGQSIELFVIAVEMDTNNDSDTEKTIISKDIKDLFEFLLIKEDTRAIMFMIGHFLPFFFFRDKGWVRNLLNIIFPTNDEKKYLYLAAWEGYLTNELYIEIFLDRGIQQLYKRAITLTEKDYPNQNHFTNPDVGIAQDFALAYMVTDFQFGNELFDFFWKNGNIDQHIAFVNKLGRIFISGESLKALQVIKENKNAGTKIKYMWDWLLENYSNPKIFEGIGFWIDLKKEFFRPKELADYVLRTLRITKGYLNWDIGLLENIVVLAKSSPKDTVEIIRLFLLEGCVRNNLNPIHFIFDKKWVEVFQILFLESETKELTESLINDLIRDGGGNFWSLKDILEKN